ncbi:MAG: exodeoxyribonuclease VII small subunit [bacterium]|jgi:exodeoxyribonuclease VII small subunit
MAQVFETNLEKLEEIVKTLDSGNIPLDAALKAFEQGIKLSRQCHKKLNDTEKKIEILLKTDGEITGSEPFEKVEE